MVLHTATLHKPHIVSHHSAGLCRYQYHGDIESARRGGHSGSQGVRLYEHNQHIWLCAHAAGRARRPPGLPRTVAPIAKEYLRSYQARGRKLVRAGPLGATELPCAILRTARFFPEQDDDETCTRGL